MLYYIFVFFGVCDVCVLSSPNAVAVPSTFSAALVCAYRIAALVYLGREVPNSLLFTVCSCLLRSSTRCRLQTQMLLLQKGFLTPRCEDPSDQDQMQTGRKSSGPMVRRLADPLFG